MSPRNQPLVKTECNAKSTPHWPAGGKIRAIWILWALATIGVVLARSFFLEIPGAEAAILIGAIVAALLTTGLPESWRGSRRTFRWGMVLILILVTGGHLLKRSDHTFPFVAWEMFTTVEHKPRAALQYTGKLRDGKEIEFHPARQARVLGDSRIDLKLLQQVELMERSPAGTEQHAKLLSEHKRTVAALGRMHNRRNPENTITEIEVYKAQYLQQREKRRFTVVKRLLWKVALEVDS